MIGTLIIEKVTFDVAYQAAKEGKIIAREYWNGSDKFVFMRPEDQLPYGVLLNIFSIPDSVKNWFIKKAETVPYEEFCLFKFSAYLCMKDADNNIENGWYPSPVDVLAEDWFII
ncbi:Thoeris anti-defense Tad2 family protein [Pedobacter sp. NJ-S-72]